MSDVKLILGDCLKERNAIPDGSVDMVLCDLPYGTTDCRWDSVIPFEPLWAHYKRVCKPNAAIVLFGSQPFTSVLVSSNVEWFRYAWVWDKVCPTGFANAKRQPLRQTEDVAVFYRSTARYNPQGLERALVTRRNSKNVGGESLREDVEASSGKGCLRTAGGEYVQEFTGYPRNLVKFGKSQDKGHPTQKPVALCEYLIRTYTDEGETVLDNTMGSGTTGVACVNTNRNFIGIEKEYDYFKTACQRTGFPDTYEGIL